MLEDGDIWNAVADGVDELSIVRACKIDVVDIMIPTVPAAAASANDCRDK